MAGLTSASVGRVPVADARFDVVIPTIGRPGLGTVLHAVHTTDGPRPEAIVVADDRPGSPARLAIDGTIRPCPTVVRVGGRGPAAARNAGWTRCASPWVVFLDDDVVPAVDWSRRLIDDLAACPPFVGAVQGRVEVPLPTDRPWTDYERNVGGLSSASWITADMAVRRTALLEIGGFDERFRRAYREDTDLALRLADAGWTLRRGSRKIAHPVGRSTWRTSIDAQRGNADDALMRRLHGASWRRRGGARRGALASHVLTVGLAVASGASARRSRRMGRVLAIVAALRIGRFWWSRTVPGPRSPGEWARMAMSSIVIPFAATGWRLWGTIRALRLAPRGRADRWAAHVPELVLFDRDGTLIHDVPYNGDPERVVPVDGAAVALGRLRRAGVPVGMITNQSAIGHGWLNRSQVDAVNDRVEALLGPFVDIEICPHTEGARCRCRKPAPGMVLDAARKIGVAPSRCAVVGDIGADVGAALAVGARAVLVPTPRTQPAEILAAPECASDLEEAVDLLIGATRGWS